MVQRLDVACAGLLKRNPIFTDGNRRPNRDCVFLRALHSPFHLSSHPSHTLFNELAHSSVCDKHGRKNMENFLFYINCHGLRGKPAKVMRSALYSHFSLDLCWCQRFQFLISIQSFSMLFLPTQLTLVKHQRRRNDREYMWTCTKSLSKSFEAMLHLNTSMYSEEWRMVLSTLCRRRMLNWWKFRCNVEK